MNTILGRFLGLVGAMGAAFLALRRHRPLVWDPPLIPPPPPVVPRLPALRVNGHVFQLETGEPFTAIMCSDFNLFGRYLTEPVINIRDVLYDRTHVQEQPDGTWRGFNLLRVWTRYTGNETFIREIGHLQPAEHPDFYARIPPFLALCAEYGLYVQLTAYTGGPAEDHWERLGAAVQGCSNVILELVNENNGYRDNLNTDRFAPIPGVLCSHGSNVSEAMPPLPAWDYADFHTNDAFEWWRKGGHNGMELSHGEGENPGLGVPVLESEKTRPDRDPIVTHHRDSAAAAVLLIAGSCFHSRSGKRSVPFDDFDRPFARAFLDGAYSVPLACQQGGYRHRQSDEGPEDLRIYQRGDDPICVVRIAR